MRPGTLAVFLFTEFVKSTTSVPTRAKMACKTGRSIALAHGLEKLCEVRALEKRAN